MPKQVEYTDTLLLSTSTMHEQLLARQIEDAGKMIEPKIEWRYPKQVSQILSLLVVEGLLYFIADKGGVLTCLDAEANELVWGKRLGRNYSASLVYVDSKLYYFDREGTTHVIAPGRVFIPLAKNQLDSGLMMSSAIVDGACTCSRKKRFASMRPRPFSRGKSPALTLYQGRGQGVVCERKSLLDIAESKACCVVASSRSPFYVYNLRAATGISNAPRRSFLELQKNYRVTNTGYECISPFSTRARSRVWISSILR